MYRPMEFHLEVFWTTKSDFLQNLGVPLTMSDDAEKYFFRPYARFSQSS